MWIERLRQAIGLKLDIRRGFIHTYDHSKGMGVSSVCPSAWDTEANSEHKVEMRAMVLHWTHCNFSRKTTCRTQWWESIYLEDRNQWYPPEQNPIKIALEIIENRTPGAREIAWK